MTTVASQITCRGIVCPRVYWSWHQKSILLALYEGNPPVTGGFTSQRASNIRSVSMWWCYHDIAYSTASCRMEYNRELHIWEDKLMHTRITNKLGSMSIRYWSDPEVLDWCLIDDILRYCFKWDQTIFQSLKIWCLHAKYCNEYDNGYTKLQCNHSNKLNSYIFSMTSTALKTLQIPMFPHILPLEFWGVFQIQKHKTVRFYLKTIINIHENAWELQVANTWKIYL